MKFSEDILTLYQELACIIDRDIMVYYGDKNESVIGKKIIYISNKKDIDDFIVEYLTIDLGFEYFKYCSSNLYWFIHELGHIVNGWIDRDAYSLITTTLKANNDPTYKNLYQYVRLTDEIYANEWAMEFIKLNKKMIKDLDKEINGGRKNDK